MWHYNANIFISAHLPHYEIVFRMQLSILSGFLCTLLSLNSATAYLQLCNGKYSCAEFTHSVNSVDRRLITSPQQLTTVSTLRPRRPSSDRKRGLVAYLFPSSTYPYVNEAVIVNGIGALLILSSQQKSLTVTGVWHATMLGIGLWSFLDFNGWFVCLSYLLLGSFVTMVKMKEKEVQH